MTRDKVWHPGAVGILAVDDEYVWLTRQPREAVGRPASLEVPAGKLDVGRRAAARDGQARARRGDRQARRAVGGELFAFFTSPGFSDERVWLYLATGLSDEPERTSPTRTSGSRSCPGRCQRSIEAIEQCHDSKSLIALLWLKAQRG